MDNIEQIIKEINNIFDTKCFNQGFLKGTNHKAASFFYTGACWYYAYLLKKIYPQGEILISDEERHVIFKLNDKYYDVNGKILYVFNIKSFFVDEENINSPAFIHPEEELIMATLDYILYELKAKKILEEKDDKIVMVR